MVSNSETYNIANLKELEDFLRQGVIPNHQSDANGPLYFINSANSYILVDESKISFFHKVPEIEKALFLADVKLFLAMYNKYLPIFSKETKQLLFSEEEFLAMRKKMSGLKKYNAGDFIFSDDLSFPGIDELMAEIAQNNAKVISEENTVKDYLKQFLESLGSVSFELGQGDIELLGTGSTSRGTSLPPSDTTKNGDYDFALRVSPSQMEEVKNLLAHNLNHLFGQTSPYRFRFYGVRVAGLNKLADIDISFIPTKEIYYSTDQALSDRLETIKNQDEMRYRMVIANIVKAKKVLKAAGVYKAYRSDNKQGGLGGVGIENWILQYGGSFKEAALDFLTHAQGKSFIEFEKDYHIIDFGNNHVSKAKGDFPYDSFIVKNMRQEGFLKMCTALEAYLKSLSNDENLKLN